MKHLRLIFAGLPLLLLAGCWGYGNSDDVVVDGPLPDNQYDAVVMDREEFDNSVQILPQQSFTKAGKIYIKDGYLFVSDVNRGFHIFVYDDPSNPVYKGFLNAPGATDLAMRDNIIYINQATDLVAMQLIPSSNSVLVTKRNKDVFPPMHSPNGSWEDVAENEVVVGWEEL